MSKPDEAGVSVTVLILLPAGERGRLLSLVLKGFGYEPVPCRNREELEAALAFRRPAAAVVDLAVEEAFQSCALIQRTGGVALLGLTDPNRLDLPRLSLPVDMVRNTDTPLDEILQVLRQLVIGRRAQPGSAAPKVAPEARG